MQLHEGDMEPLIPSHLKVNGRNQLCGVAHTEVWLNAMTDGRSLSWRRTSTLRWMENCSRLNCRCIQFWDLLAIPSGWAAITGPQMWNNRSLHWKEQMNIDSGVGLIGTIVFPEGELMTWSQLGDIWRPITAAAPMVTWFCCTLECFLIRQRRSPAINIALSAAR